MFLFLVVSFEFGKKGKTYKTKWLRILSASLCGWQTTHIHFLDENLPAVQRFSEDTRELAFSYVTQYPHWEGGKRERVSVWVCVSHFQIDHYDATFISSQYLFVTFFFVVNVKLSHFSYCSTHFLVILTVTLRPRAYGWLTTICDLVCWMQQTKDHWENLYYDTMSCCFEQPSF